MEEENNNKKKIKEITIAVVACVFIFGGLIGASIGLYNMFYNNKEMNTVAVTHEKMDDEKEKEITVNLNEPEQEQEKEEENKEEEKRELTEEEKQKLEEQRKKQEEERKKREEEQRKSYAQKYPYYIKVNYSANTTTVYGKDENGDYTVPVRAMVCSTGAQTPRSGVYRTSDKYVWGTLIGPVWGQYCTRITGGILFHSVPYLKNRDKSSLEYWEYDRLGEARSLGCIRLTVIDAKWVYDNCPSGTSVEFYSSAEPGPWGKPWAKKISAYEDLRGWDPTDPDPNNPWRHQEELEEKKRAEEEAARKAEEERIAREEAERLAREQREREEAERLAREEEERRNQVTVPQLEGLDVETAKTTLRNLGLQFRIGNMDSTKTPNKVVTQSEASGTVVDKRYKIIVLTIDYITPEPNPNNQNGQQGGSENNSNNGN